MAATPHVIDFSDCVLSPQFSRFARIARAQARRETAAQGLPPKVTDVPVIGKIATLLILGGGR